MQNVRELKKGEYLYQEGDKPTHVYLVQSGKVSLVIERPNQKSEIGIIANNQIAGVLALFGAKTHNHSAVAGMNCKVVEMPISAIHHQFENESQLMKVILKSLGDQLKTATNGLKSLRLEQDNSPCPQNVIAKIFGILALLGRKHGHPIEVDTPDSEEKTPAIEMQWDDYKNIGYRMFNVEPERIKSAIELCSKLGFCHLIESENPSTLAQGLDKIQFTDLDEIEAFADFMQAYSHKFEIQGSLGADLTSMKIVDGLIEFYDEMEEGRFGGKKVHFAAAAEKIQKKHRIQLTPTLLDVLQKKGAKVIQNQSGNLGVFLEYDRDQLEKVLKHWRILGEIEKWNQNGFVDMNEPAEELCATQEEESGCPSCKVELEGEHNFCPQCGFRLKEAA